MRYRSLNISNEQKLVLLLSSPFCSDCRQEEIQKIIQDKRQIDLNEVCRLALECEVAGFVYRNVKLLALDVKEIKDKLTPVYQEAALNNMAALKETLVVLKFLSAHDIPVIPLKGVYASDKLFRDFGVYPSSDIDLLVPLNLLEKIKRILQSECDYTPVEEFFQEDLLDSHYHLIFKRRMTVEVHWNLVKRYFSIPGDFWWKSALPVEWEGERIMDLTIENNILYQVFRLFDHCFYPLRFFVLLSALIEKNFDQINWGGLIRTADGFGMKKLVLATLNILNDLLGTSLPDVVSRQRTRGYPLLRRLIFSGIFSGVSRKHLKMMVYTVILIETKTVVRIFFGRLFPSIGELRLRYNLPASSSSVYLYYILNPILLIFNSEDRRKNA
ncbi:nucleotidyltransferase family protein [uncultured Desulfobacter sp.]|uniref:nucleotidyltransferase domain-containing protein n=1 Tax=uncultured Desulfobacter sp. TaxID=240139 RepID=UPI0029F4F7E8|nr:nucleotidyltransferase family protein [uncultured Desulfobacter sp.]